MASSKLPTFPRTHVATLVLMNIKLGISMLKCNDDVQSTNQRLEGMLMNWIQ